MSLRTPQQARDALAASGTSLTQWALDNQVSPNLVSDVLAGRNKASRGMSHIIAVKLRLKKGVINTSTNTLEHVA